MTFKASVIRGNPSQVMAYLQAEGSDYEEPHELTRSSTVLSEFTLSLYQRQKTFHIRFVANDFQSKKYTVVVTPAPMITEWLLRYSPPEYTGEEPFASPTPDITGLEGTEVTVEAVTNLPVAPNSAHMEFKLAKPTASVDMKVADSADNRISGKFTLTGDGSYSVLFSDLEGRTPLFRPVNNIRVLKDLPPSVEFQQPSEKVSSLPTNQPLSVAAQVRDDIGLRHITLSIHKKGTDEEPIVFEKGGRPGDALGLSETISETVDLTKWKLIPGDILEYWIDAEDNKLPKSNSTSTRNDSRIVHITKPIEAPPPAEPNDKDNSEPNGKESPKEGEKSDKDIPVDPTKNDKSANAPIDPDKKNEGESSDQKDTGKDSLVNKDDQKQGSGDSKHEGEPKNIAQQQSNENENRDQDKGQDTNSRKSSPDGEQKISDEDRRDLDKLREFFAKRMEQINRTTPRKIKPIASLPRSRSVEFAAGQRQGSKRANRRTIASQSVRQQSQ